jgi:Fe-S-cluster containining protein
MKPAGTDLSQSSLFSLMESCKGCDGSCCRGIFVPLTCSDVRRLSDAGLDWMEYIDFSPVGGIETVYPDVRLGNDYYHMVLRKRADGSCSLSALVDDRLTCSVHGLHPTVCRLYPFDEFGGGFRKRVLCARSCEPDFDVDALAGERKAQWEEYSEKVRVWNGSPRARRGVGDFVGFLLG